MTVRNVSIQQGAFITLLVLVTLAFLGLIQDFLQPLFWASVLAVIFHPLQVRWEGWLRGHASWAALGGLLTIVFIVILPLVLVGVAVSQEAIGLYQRIASGQIELMPSVRELQDRLPIVADMMERFGVDLEQIKGSLSEAAMAASSVIASQALQIGQNALRIGVQFFLMLYILFFFLRDGRTILEGIIRALPLGDVRERRLFAKFAEVARATLKGTLVVGFVQGALGGLLFWILGIGAPVFWGVIMMILSLLPAVGAALIWGPAAIYLLATDAVVRGIIMIAAGTLLVGLADNILRPILVGRDTKMPDYLILLATLGGLTLFGLSGFVIGPVIAALFLTVWDMFAEEYAVEQEPERIIQATSYPEAELPSPIEEPEDSPPTT